MEPWGIWWKLKKQQPQVSAGGIPTGCEAVVEWEWVQEIAQSETA